jgi:hypothetical protein
MLYIGLPPYPRGRQPLPFAIRLISYALNIGDAYARNQECRAQIRV